MPERAERPLLAWLLLVPVVACLWPGPLAPLGDDPYPHLAGAGWSALLGLGLAVALLARPGELPVLAVLPLVLAFLPGDLRFLVGGLSDSFEARRAVVMHALALLAFTAGAGTGARGRRVLADGALAITALALGYELLVARSLGHGELAGVLGNTGALSQAALPGAVIGALAATRARGARRLVGLAAAGAFLAHAALAPVIAGALAFAGALVVSGLLGRPATKRTRAAELGLAALALALLVAARARPAEPTADAGALAGVAAETGGFEVRARIFGRVPDLVAEAPLLGVGPGQFRARFPPHRDPREAVLSRHGPCSELATEVEHPHDDWLLGVAEQGLVGGAFWIAFLALVALRSLLAVWRGAREAPLAAAALALLANALVHAPLSHDAPAALLAFAAFGAVTPPARPGDGRLLARAIGLAGLAAAWCAWPLVAHGRALGDYVRAARGIDRALSAAPNGAPDGAPDEALREAARAAAEALERAHAAAPDAAPALYLRARAAAPQEREAAWRAVLAVRPESFEAFEQLGVDAARNGRPDEARALWERALALEPGHPRVLRNLARLDVETGDAERGLARLDELERLGCLDPRFREGLAAELVLGGRTRAGRALLVAGDPSLAGAIPEALWARAEAAEAAGDAERESVFRTLAHLGWARQQADAGRFDVAVRSYRQAVLSTVRAGGSGAPALFAELAAALCADGRRAEAEERLRGVALAPESLAELPAWARDALSDAGFAVR